MVKRTLFFLLLLLQGLSSLFSQVRLPSLISNGMILQRDTKLKIWGWAAPGEKVSLMLSTDKSKAYTAVANKKGEWTIHLSKQKPGGPYYMKIVASNHIVIDNILIGDVWLCSGQSNMEQTLGGRLKYRYADEIANANNSSIRQFLVPDKYNFNQSQKDIPNANWQILSPQTAPDFTAVGYFFAKELYEKNKVPVGIINAALGGSPAQAWISEEALKKFPGYYTELQESKDSANIVAVEKKEQAISYAWQESINKADLGQAQQWKSTLLNDADWTTMDVPGYWNKTPGQPFAAVLWLRKQITVPSSMAGKPAKLELGRIIDADSVFINERYVGNTTYQYPARRYELPAGILHEGTNTIVIRVQSNGGLAGFVPEKRYELTTATDTISLTGKWKYRSGHLTNRPAPPTTFFRWKPGGLYNAMIAPLTSYAIKGTVWYQGEANTSSPTEYADLMNTLINDWRKAWDNPFPFLLVQLPNFMEATNDANVNSNWAALRQQQLETLKVPGTALAVTIDLGEWNDIHPENKKDVGHRLALLARKEVYGEKNLIASGPIFKSVKRKGHQLEISFTNTGSGLVAKDNNLSQQFAIAGKEGKVVWANAIIKGDKVIVWTDANTEPLAVRYAWADNPVANLYNKEGLPASPFGVVVPAK